MKLKKNYLYTSCSQNRLLYAKKINEWGKPLTRTITFFIVIFKEADLLVYANGAI